MKTLETMTEQELAEYCRACADSLKAVAKSLWVEPPKFALVLFNDPRVAQYIGNCTRADIILAMRETADRLERKQDVTR